MAKKEVVTAITIKTEQSQQTIKGLRKEIADLKKSLDNATIGSEEFQKASRELATAQATLKTVLADGNKSIDAVEGSYNHLVATMAELKKQWRATADEVKRNELGEEIDKINNQLKEMDYSIGNHQRNVGNYAADVGKALEQNNNSVAASATAFKQALGEVDDATIKTRMQLESVQKVTSGLASGYAAVQGAMALLNIENENLQKAMVKVQSAMAIAQGVGGMKDLVEGLSRAKVAFGGAVSGCKMFIAGLSGVQKAIIATGIGALIVAVGLLIANFDKIKKLIDNINPERKAAKATAEYNAEISKLAAQSAGDKIARVKELALAYGKLGDNLNNKKEFVTKYKEELGKMGIEMNNVNDADRIFVTQTDAYIKALMARAKAEAIKQKATEDYKKGLDIIAEAEKKAVEGGTAIVEGLKGGVFGKLQLLWGAYKVSSAGEDYGEARKLMEDNFEKAFEEAAKYEKEAAKYLTDGKTGGGGTGGSGKTDAQKAAEERAKKQAEVLEEFRTSQLTEEAKLYDNLEKKYQEYMELFKGDTEKQLMVVEWYTVEYAKLVEKQIDDEIKAKEQITKAAEETTKKLAEEEQKRYEDAVAASEKRLGAKLEGYGKAEEKQLYLNERQQPQGNGEINAIDNELTKLEGLETITKKMSNLRVAAIEEEQKLFDEHSLRWLELEQQKVEVREQTERTLAEISKQYAEQEKNRQRTLAKSITNTFTSALNSASQIIGALQEGIDTTNKEGFEKNKKMQIATATIQMLVGITSALSGAFTTKSGPWDIALAAIQAATIATTGGIQIANIKKQKFDGGDSSSSVSVPSVSMGDNMPISYTRNLMGDAETEELSKAQQVYILESDIEDSRRKVDVRESNTDF